MKEICICEVCKGDAIVDGDECLCPKCTDFEDPKEGEQIIADLKR